MPLCCWKCLNSSITAYVQLASPHQTRLYAPMSDFTAQPPTGTALGLHFPALLCEIHHCLIKRCWIHNSSQQLHCIKYILYCVLTYCIGCTEVTRCSESYTVKSTICLFNSEVWLPSTPKLTSPPVTYFPLHTCCIWGDEEERLGKGVGSTSGGTVVCVA